MADESMTAFICYFTSYSTEHRVSTLVEKCINSSEVKYEILVLYLLCTFQCDVQISSNKFVTMGTTQNAGLYCTLF